MVSSTGLCENHRTASIHVSSNSQTFSTRIAAALSNRSSPHAVRAGGTDRRLVLRAGWLLAGLSGHARQSRVWNPSPVWPSSLSVSRSISPSLSQLWRDHQCCPFCTRLMDQLGAVEPGSFLPVIDWTDLHPLGHYQFDPTSVPDRPVATHRLFVCDVQFMSDRPRAVAVQNPASIPVLISRFITKNSLPALPLNE